MYKATWDRQWGTRMPRTYSHRYFTRKPTIEEVIKAFAEECPRMNKKWFESHCSGLITISKVKVEF